MKTLKQRIEGAYRVVATPPQWDEHRVERILKSHGPLNETDNKELHKALDYWSYVNDTAEDDDELEKVTDNLVSIMDRLESAGRLPKNEEQHYQGMMQ